MNNYNDNNDNIINNNIINENQNKFNLTDWSNYIDYKKLLIIKKIDSTNYLDDSIENMKFIKILKSIIESRIFDISHISFLSIKLLEYTYIKSEIINDAFEINNSNTDSSNTNNNDNDNNIKIILKIIVDFIVYIEITLNLHCILIVYFLKNIKHKNENNNKNDSRYPKILNVFNKFNDSIDNTTIDNTTIDNHNELYINPSTLILLLLKLTNKLFIPNLENDKTNIIKLHINYIKSQKQSSIKFKIYLDTFIIKLTTYFFKQNDINDNVNNDKNNDVNNTDNIYKICIEYINLIIDLLFNQFNNLFDILETYLIISINNNEKEDINKDKINKDKINNLNNIKNGIKKLLDTQINSIRELFIN